MKKILFALSTLFLVLWGCTDSTSSSGEGKSLVLNDACKSFQADTSLWSEERGVSLDSVKSKIASCASLEISWDSAHRYFDWLLFSEGDEKDSIVRFTC